MSRPQAPRGTFDVLPEQAARRAVVEETATRILGDAGYGRIETPTFEATDLFARGVGEATDIVQKEMYSFDDGALTLRPEGTAPICRAYVEHGMHKLAQPVRLWYLGSYYRHEAPQAGRHRQFWQVGAEAIGSADPALDAEVVLLLADLLDALAVGGLRLRISSLGSPEARAAYRERLTAYLRDHESELSPEVVSRIDHNPLRAFDSAHEGTRRVMAGAPRLLDALDAEDADHFAEVRAILDAAGLPYEIDPTLVRGLDYYTRTVFEFTSEALGAQSGVGGGGRYDRLVELIGGPATPGVGWAAGVERILLAGGETPVSEPVVDLYVAPIDPARRAEAVVLATEARRAGLGAQVEAAGRSTKGVAKHADRIGARFLAVLGEEGDAAGRATLRDMEAGEQREVGRDEVIPCALRGELPA